VNQLTRRIDRAFGSAGVFVGALINGHRTFTPLKIKFVIAKADLYAGENVLVISVLFDLQFQLVIAPFAMACEQNIACVNTEKAEQRGAASALVVNTHTAEIFAAGSNIDRFVENAFA